MTSVPKLNELLADRRWMRSLARRLVEPAEVDDLVQDVAGAALQDPGRVREPGRWVRGAMRRLAANRRRAMARLRRRDALAATSITTESAARSVERADLENRVADAIRDLPSRSREAILLRFWEGLAPRRIAQRLGVPVETVRTRIRRGLAVLRVRLDELHPRRAWLAALSRQPRSPWFVVGLAVAVLVLWFAWPPVADTGDAELARPRFAWVRTLGPNGDRLDDLRVRWRGHGGEVRAVSGLAGLAWPPAFCVPEPMDPQLTLVCAHRVGPMTVPATFSMVAAPVVRCAGVLTDRAGVAVAGAELAFRLPRDLPARLGVDGDLQFGDEPRGSTDHRGAFDLGDVASVVGAELVIDARGHRFVSEQVSGTIRVDP